MDYLALRRLPLKIRLSQVEAAAKNLYHNEDLETLLAHMLIETETNALLTGGNMVADVNRKAMMRDGVTAIFDEMQNVIDAQAHEEHYG